MTFIGKHPNPTCHVHIYMVYEWPQSKIRSTLFFWNFSYVYQKILHKSINSPIVRFRPIQFLRKILAQHSMPTSLHFKLAYFCIKKIGFMILKIIYSYCHWLCYTYQFCSKAKFNNAAVRAVILNLALFLKRAIWNYKKIVTISLWFK